jgi:hypothetical protein
MHGTLKTLIRRRAFLAVLLLALSATPSQAAPIVRKSYSTFKPTPDMTVYFCTSRLGGYCPRFGLIYHASVAFCPPGESPVVWRDGCWMSNPRCIYLGTQPGHSTFLIDVERYEVEFRPVPLPAMEVYERIKRYNRPWRFLSNNCRHAAADVTD